jgi:hypothetical protein
MYPIHPYGQSAQRGHCSIEEAAPVSARIAPLSPTRRAMKGRMGDVMTWECSTNDYRKRLENMRINSIYIYTRMVINQMFLLLSLGDYENAAGLVGGLEPHDSKQGDYQVCPRFQTTNRDL